MGNPQLSWTDLVQLYFVVCFMMQLKILHLSDIHVVKQHSYSYILYFTIKCSYLLQRNMIKFWKLVFVCDVTKKITLMVFFYTCSYWNMYCVIEKVCEVFCWVGHWDPCWVTGARVGSLGPMLGRCFNRTSPHCCASFLSLAAWRLERQSLLGSACSFKGCEFGCRPMHSLWVLFQLDVIWMGP